MAKNATAPMITHIAMLFIIYLHFVLPKGPIPPDAAHYALSPFPCLLEIQRKSNSAPIAVTILACDKIPGMKPSPKPTSFQMKVYKATACIPRGKVATYGWVARQIGCRSAQAVGGALRVNPFAPKVPCHRVIASDGSLHGFTGHTSGPLLAKKRRLLQEEGIAFDALGRVLKDQILQ